MPLKTHQVALPARGSRTPGRRRQIDQVLLLAEHLPASDRMLLERVYRHGMTIREAGRIVGLPPRRAQRRVLTLRRRLVDPLFNFVAADHALVPETVRPVARRVVLEGRSMRDAARLTGRSYHRVREQMRLLQHLARSFG